MEFPALAAGNGLTAVESGGFDSLDKIKGLSWGFKRTSDSDLNIAAIFDRDYRSDDEINSLIAEMQHEGVISHFHDRKEIENYLLCLPALGRALHTQILHRKGKAPPNLDVFLMQTLQGITDDALRAKCSGQYVTSYCRFHARSGRHQADLAVEATAAFDQQWEGMETRLVIVPGKQVLRSLRKVIQEKYKVTLTDFRIINSFRKQEVPTDLVELIQGLERFRSKATR